MICSLYGSSFDGFTPLRLYTDRGLALRILLCRPRISVVLASYLRVAQPFLPVASDIHPECSFHSYAPPVCSFIDRFQCSIFASCTDGNLHFLSGVFRHFITGADTDLNAQITAIDDAILAQAARKEKIRRFLDELKNTGDILTEFDENSWSATVESVTVNTDKSLTFLFRDGTEILIPTTNGAE